MADIDLTPASGKVYSKLNGFWYILAKTPVIELLGKAPRIKRGLSWGWQVVLRQVRK
jgi:hypothetical protein